MVTYAVTGPRSGLLQGAVFLLLATLDTARAEDESLRMNFLPPRSRDEDGTMAQEPNRGRHSRAPAEDDVDTPGRMTIANCTCRFLTQPLDHFSSSSLAGTFPQRYCVYGGYDPTYDNGDVADSERGGGPSNPIFFYTGNESPVDQYANQTGLMWELAPRHSALVVFAEHRYQGLSVPDFTLWNDPTRRSHDGCMTYLTSSQALADYADLLSILNPGNARPVIAFGGSYGGMLSAWMRMKYPGSVAGAIAASAPIWGLPLTQEDRRGKQRDDASGIGGSHRVVGRGVTLPYPPNASVRNGAENHCFGNLLAAWPLVHFYGQTEAGRSLLSEIFRLCNPLRKKDDVESLLEWAQSPWFDLAEGDFPFPSSYIPFSLNMGKNDLPAWPVQKACHSSGLNRNLGIEFKPAYGSTGSMKSVQYKIQYGEGGIVLNVDWDKVIPFQNNTENGVDQSLLNAVRGAISIWFNITGEVTCFDAIPAINEDPMPRSDNDFGYEKNALSSSEKKTLQNETSLLPKSSSTYRHLRVSDKKKYQGTEGTMYDSPPPRSPAEVCQEKIDSETVWTSLVCNENMYQITTLAHGMGDDFFWPPSHPKGIKSYSDIVALDADPNGVASICADPSGVYGFPPQQAADPWSTWLDDYYGGSRIDSYSNIIFSNGLLDPWAAAGVYAHGMNPTEFIPQPPPIYPQSYGGDNHRDVSMMQNITADGSIIALLLNLGGHHLDLMYSDRHDPECAIQARLVEDDRITEWVKQWYTNNIE